MMSSREDDLFESVIFFEENCVKEGYQDGYNEGRVSGWHIGFEIGLQKGRELGDEVGFYKGFVSAWLACSDVNRHDSVRVKPKLESLLKLLTQDWSDNTRDLTSELDTVRVKFKQICSLLSINAEYTTAKASQLSF